MKMEDSLPTGAPAMLRFDRFCFPVLPSLIYQTDGPDKAHPDRLFIEDRKGRFLFYLESGSGQTEETDYSLPDYDTVEMSRGEKHLTLHYPLQIQRPDISVGYFALAFGGEAEPCCGNLSIRLPTPYLEGLRAYEDLNTLFAGARLAYPMNGQSEKSEEGRR